MNDIFAEIVCRYKTKYWDVQRVNDQHHSGISRLTEHVPEISYGYKMPAD